MIGVTEGNWSQQQETVANDAASKKFIRETSGSEIILNARLASDSTERL